MRRTELSVSAQFARGTARRQPREASAGRPPGDLRPYKPCADGAL